MKFALNPSHLTMIQLYDFCMINCLFSTSKNIAQNKYSEIFIFPQIMLLKEEMFRKSKWDALCPHTFLD